VRGAHVCAPRDGPKELVDSPERRFRARREA
jgi:hypothetical protein